MSLPGGKKCGCSIIPELVKTCKSPFVCPDLHHHFYKQYLRNWNEDLLFRITMVFYCCTLLILTIGSTYLIYTQLKAIQQSFQERGLSVGRTFATIGGAAVLGNLYRIQEAMEQYRQDPDFRFLEVVDENSIIVAALHPDRIALKLEDPF